MFQKKFRLKGKDVRFLTRKWIRYYGKYFSFHSFPQYPNILHNQISCHISIKYDKRAVHRNRLKRIILQYMQKNNIATKKFLTWWNALISMYNQWKNGYYKIFIGLNKQNIEIFKEKIKKLDKKMQKRTIEQLLTEHFAERMARLERQWWKWWKWWKKRF